MNRPSVCDYLDYRTYLKDMFQFQKANAPHFSYRFFSKKAGFASPNFLQLVIKGQRNLTNGSIAKVAKGFDLKKREREFFEYLVFMNQATANDEKNYYYRKMISITGYKGISTIEKDRFEYFTRWYYPAIRELLPAAPDAKTPEKIAAKLNPKITPKQAETALQLLEKLELIRQTSDGGWEQIQGNITTGPEIKSMAVANFHKEMIGLSMESIDRFEASQRDISGLTLSIRQEKFQEMKAKLISFRKELLELTSIDENPDMVVQLNIQLFPLTK